MVLFLGGIMGEQYTIAERMKQLRNITGFNRAEFARQQGIPLRTIEEWEAGRRKMPEYVLRLLAYKIQLESSKKDQRIHIIQDENNKSIVLINDIRFKSRRNIDWNEIEEYLKEYIGNTYEILETCEKIYIGNDFPDEFCHSKDKIRLKGANEKAKAKKGWYRYDTRFGIPKRQTGQKRKIIRENMERKQRKAGIVMIQDLAYQNMMKMENLKDIIYILQKCL